MPKAALTLAAVTLAAAGCTKQTYVEQQKVDQEPMVVDQAMQQRQWEPVTAYYENGDTFSPSTGFRYVPDHDLGPYTYAVTDTGTYVVNLFTMPVTFYEQRAGVLSGGVKLPPSYTAVPPMPPTTRPTE